MSDLNPCGICGAPATEHIRGEFHAKTRKDLPENNTPGACLVDMDESTQDDYRIACSKVLEKDFVPKRPGDWVTVREGCENFLPWSAPTLKLVAAAKEQWNRLNPVRAKSYGNRQSD